MPDFPPETVAFITGASSGIGLAATHRLVLDGIKNIALVDLTETSLVSAIKSLDEPQMKNTTLELIAADCSVEEQVESAIAKTVRKFGRIDICFNAAGIAGQLSAMAEQSTENLDRVLGINLRGLWLCERAQIQQMMKQELRAVSTGLPLQTRGSILNVGSILSHLAIPGINPYIMAKHGVLGLTKADAMDYAKHGIRINCLVPGWIQTAMTAQFREDAAVSESLVARQPMARWGLPEEVAFMVSFLLSDRASFSTGGSYHVDGGYAAC